MVKSFQPGSKRKLFQNNAHGYLLGWIRFPKTAPRTSLVAGKSATCKIFILAREHYAASGKNVLEFANGNTKRPIYLIFFIPFFLLGVFKLSFFEISRSQILFLYNRD